LAVSPGLKRVHCSAPAAQGSRRTATVNSKLLVEENRKPVKGKSESRDVERLFRLVVSPESKLRSYAGYASISATGRQGSKASRWSRRAVQQSLGILCFPARNLTLLAW